MRRSPIPSHQYAVLAAAAVLASALPARAINITWTGNGANADWTTTANWAGGTPVLANDAFVGTGFASGTLLTFNAPSSINSLTLTTTSPFNLRRASGGAAVYLFLASGNLTRQNVAGTEADQFLDIDLSLGASGTWDIAGSNTLTVRGTITDPQFSTSGLTKTGSGTLVLDAISPYDLASPYKGPTNLSAGRIRLQDNAGIGVGTVSVAAGATLEFNSTNISIDSPLHLAGDGVPIGQFLSDGAIKNIAGFGGWSGPVTLLANSSVNVQAGDFTFDGPISDGAGSFVLTKFGAGNLYLFSPSTYHGGTNVSGGTLFAFDPAALGTGPIAVAVNAQLTLASSATAAYPNAISLAGTGTPTLSGAIENTTGSNTLAGTITLTANSSIAVDANSTLTLTGLVTDNSTTRSLTKIGGGTLVFNHNMSFTGGLLVNEGTLRLATPNAITSATPTTVQSGASVELPGGLNIARTLQLAGTGASNHGALYGSAGVNTWSGAITLQAATSLGADAGATLSVPATISGPFPLTKVGPGRLALAGSSNTFTSLTIAAGTVVLSTPTAILAGAPVSVPAAGGALELSGNISLNAPLTLAGDGVASAGALHNLAGSNTWSGNIGLPAAPTSIAVDPGTQLTLTGTLSGTGPLTKSGSGLLLLAGSGTNTGPITLAAGNLRLLTSASLGTPAALHAAASTTVELQSNVDIPRPLFLSGSGTQNTGALHSLSGINTWSGAITLEADTTLAVDASSTLTISAPVADSSPSFSLTKTGAGTLVLSNASNSYDGPTFVNGGTLSVPADASLGNPASPVSLSNGAKLLFSSGTTTSRTFNLNTGSLQVASGATLTYSNATVNGGFLRGPGTHSVAANTSLNAVTALPGTNIAVSAPATLTNFTSAATLTTSAPLAWDGGVNASAGSLTANANLSTTAFENDGVITLNSPATLTNSGNPLTSGGGSRITVNPGASLSLGATTLDLNGALLTNNGSVTGSAINVNFGSLLTGTGSFPTVIVNAGGTFQPGNTPAPLTPITNSPTGLITQTPGSFSVSAPVTLTADTTALIPGPSDSLTFTTPMTSPVNLTKTGPGSFTLPVLTAASLSANDGRLAISPSHTQASTSRLASLTLTSTGTLDLNDNDLILDQPDLATLAAATTRLRQYLFANLLTSTSAAADPQHRTALGYAANTDLARPTFNGQPTDPTTLLVKYTYVGDANLDGTLNADDFALLDRGFRTGGSTWTQGDFNYDGQVTSADYLLIDSTYLKQGAPLSPSLLAARESQFGPAYVQQLLIALPEPSPLSGLFSPLSALLLKRRFRQKSHLSA